MTYDEALELLRGWSGRTALVVAFVEPGVSLRPLAGALELEDGERRVARLVVSPPPPRPPTRIALPHATFHRAGWIAGREGRGLSVEQGAVRVDVFLEDG